jgi:hypothetical protein
MNNVDRTRTAYNFRNTCHKCYNDIEFPLLGDFAYGEMIFQTKDAKDFYIAVLIDNKTFDFVVAILKQDKAFQNKKLDPQKILALIADKADNKEFITDFPICPICKSRLRSFGDGNRTTQIELGLATWTEFENLSKQGKLSRLKEVIEN